jgi:hypothetical protein
LIPFIGFNFRMMIRRFLGNLYFLTFLNGFLLASVFYFRMEANYENDIFQAIHTDIISRITKAESGDSVLAKIMHTTHNLLINRGSVFEGKQFDDFKSDIIEPTSMDLMTARGACGSYAMVLARILQDCKYPVRIAQMKSNGVFAAHNIVEVQTPHGWVVLDPLYDIYFIKPSLKLASFEDVKNNWSYYKTQLPTGYNMSYQYEDVRYSNWTKIPIVLPAIKKILDLTIGKPEADKISLRTFFLKKYSICYSVVLFLFVLVFAFTLVKLIQAKVFPRKNIPVTFSNVYKYLRLRFQHKQLPEHGQA